MTVERTARSGQIVRQERIRHPTRVPPWIAFVLFFAWGFQKELPSYPAPPQTVTIRLASLTAIGMLALMAAFLLVAIATGGALFGITRFAIHYLFPFCLFAALALSGLLALRVNEERFAPRLMFVSLAAALVIFLPSLEASLSCRRACRKVATKGML